VIGYIASVLVLTTFYMKTMIPLRYCAIASNIAFIAYAFLDRIYPVLVLHLLLLPLNIKRLVEIRHLIRDIKQAAAGGFSFDAMIPFLTKRTFRAGSTLFRKGAVSRRRRPACRAEPRRPDRSRECRQPEAPASSASASAWRRPFEASAVPE
jgi:hypothetical protein